MEESLCERAGHQGAHIRCSGRMAKDHHPVGVPPEVGDVTLYPSERGDLVENRVIARRVMLRLRCQFRMSQEAEDAHPIIKVDEYDALLGEICAVILILRSGSAHVSAAVNEYHYRQSF